MHTGVTNAMDTYRQSDVFKRSVQGFDQKSYRAWRECFETWVIPLAIDVAHLEEDNRKLAELIKELKDVR